MKTNEEMSKLVVVGTAGWRAYYALGPDGSTRDISGSGKLGWVPYSDDSTIIVDLTSMKGDDMLEFIMEGPMVSPRCGAWEISRFSIPRGANIPWMSGMTVERLDNVGFNVYAELALELGAVVHHFNPRVDA